MSDEHEPSEEQVDAEAVDAGGAVDDGGEHDGMGASPEALLTPEESEALLDAVRAGVPIPPPEVETRPSELGAPEGPLKKALRRADGCRSRMGLTLREGFLRMTTLPLEVAEEPTEIVSLESVLGTFEDTGATWDLVRVTPASSKASRRAPRPVLPIGIVSLGPRLCQFLVEKRLGASDAMLQRLEQPTKPLTTIDKRVLEPLVRQVVEGFFYAFTPDDEPPEVVVRKRASDETAASLQPVLRITIRIGLPTGVSEEVVLVLNGTAFVPRGGRRDARGRTEREQWAATLGALEFDLAVVLGRARGSVRDLLALEVGSLVRLDGTPDRALSVLIDDTLAMRGMPLVHQGNLAVEITEPIPELRAHGALPEPAAPAAQSLGSVQAQQLAQAAAQMIAQQQAAQAAAAASHGAAHATHAGKAPEGKTETKAEGGESEASRAEPGKKEEKDDDRRAA